MSYQHQPLGTIIASLLNFDQLCAILGEPKGVNNEKSTYAPCDGRSIKGSELEEKTRVSNTQPDPERHIKKTPDLRGKFLRGLNQMYSPGEDSLVDAAKMGDPDGANRKAGDYQADEIKAHTHTYPHINLGFNASNDGGQGHNEVDVFPDQTRTTNVSGGAETRPRNVVVYYYIKIN